jgi:hypothetical protein
MVELLELLEVVVLATQEIKQGRFSELGLSNTSHFTEHDAEKFANSYLGERHWSGTAEIGPTDYGGTADNRNANNGSRLWSVKQDEGSHGWYGNVWHFLHTALD